MFDKKTAEALNRSLHSSNRSLFSSISSCGDALEEAWMEANFPEDAGEDTNEGSTSICHFEFPLKEAPGPERIPQMKRNSDAFESAGTLEGEDEDCLGPLFNASTRSFGSVWSSKRLGSARTIASTDTSLAWIDGASLADSVDIGLAQEQNKQACRRAGRRPRIPQHYGGSDTDISLDLEHLRLSHLDEDVSESNDDSQDASRFVRAIIQGNE